MEPVPQKAVLDLINLQQLVDALARRGYRVIGPRVRDGAIIYDDLKFVSELPAGWSDQQDGGLYRLKRRDDNALFGYAVGPHSLRRFLQPPEQRLWKAEKNGLEIRFVPDSPPGERFAFFGVRSCELHAMAIQDRVFLEGSLVDNGYRSRREGCFIVAVNCGHAGGTCFCVSMNTGPKATFGFDLSLTEILEGDRHCFLVESGTAEGRSLLNSVTTRPAAARDEALAGQVIAQCAASMGRAMDTAGIKELLYRNYENPRWEDVAGRCLTCANCTLVCPTCFCTTLEDTTDLAGEHAERWQKRDSCFTIEFSFLHGGSVRKSAKSRYRQWMTHKLATWIDQFETSGCVGCGRCITWCPVGIDITEEVKAIRESESPRTSSIPAGEVTRTSGE
jgi:ferredoxin